MTFQPDLMKNLAASLVVCPTCGAHEGERCTRPRSAGSRKRDETPHYHAERVAAALQRNRSQEEEA